MERVLNDLQRTFRRRKIWLLLHSLPVSHKVVSLSQAFCVSPVELTDKREEERRVEEEPNHTTAKQSSPL
jgi:hypothetical protein